MYKEYTDRLRNIDGYILEIKDSRGSLEADIEVIRDSIQFDNWINGANADILFANMALPVGKAYRSIKDYYLGESTAVDIPVTRYIPVGDIEFTEKYLNKQIKPFNPLSIFDEDKDRIFKRNIWVVEFSAIPNIFELPCNKGNRLFIKDNGGAKKYEPFLCRENELGILMNELKDRGVKSDRQFIISEEIDILSEWRCFIHNGRILDCKNYLGDFRLLPEQPIMEETADILHNKLGLDAFAVDFGVNKEGTFLIEMHRFLACGLYGFEHKNLGKMIKCAYINEYYN